MKRVNSLWMIATLLLLVASCKDVIEKNIEGETPVIILPVAGDTIPFNPVHFKWEEMEGATKYHLEIVSPSFSAIQSFVVDSIVTGTNFYFGLDSAQYEFRLTALNAGYESKTTAPVTFWVGTSSGGSGSTVLLNEPLNNTYVNEDFDGKFSWLVLPGANTYTFELHRTSTFAGDLEDIEDQLGSISYYSLDGNQLSEDVYSWGVKAFMSNGDETAYTKRVFYVDKTDPGTATLTAPPNGQNVSLSLAPTVNFSWNFPANSGTIQSPLFAVLEVSTTTNFSSILETRTYEVGDATATENLSNMGLSPGTYYWRIVVWDEAGNRGVIPVTYHTLNVTN